VSLRARIALLVAAVVGVTVVVISATSYFAVRQSLLDDVDASLAERAELVATSPEMRQLAATLDGRELRRPRPPGGGPGGPRLADPFGDPDTYFQVIDAEGAIVDQPGSATIDLPVSTEEQAVAASGQGSVLRDVEVDGQQLRQLTVPGPDGLAIQIANDLADLDATLQGLLVTVVTVGLVGLVIAIAAGVLLTRQALKPVSRLTIAAEGVARTQDLSSTITVTRSDEVGRLAESFNAMLDALAEAREQQRQLIADASHELRTPLTALRTNIEVLARATEQHQLDEPWALELMHDARDELEALSHLVAEIVELATDTRRVTAEREPIRLDELVVAAAERASRRTGTPVETRVSPCVVDGSPTLLERAVSNLLDNAMKWNPDGTAVVAVVDNGTVSVRDHGPGIVDGDQRRIFDRFYRSPGSADVPGSGLGLAIVRQVVERHDGEVFARNEPDGGALVGFTVPVVDPAGSQEILRSS
jgi:two-component system sensor histidine kinase MprB